MELEVIKEEETKRDKREELNKIVNAWKILKGLPMEGKESKAWNSVHYSRHLKSAKQLLCLFETWENAVDCLQYVYEKLEEIGCTFTIETIVKHSDMYREKLAKGGR